MANMEDLEILRQSVEKWNALRAESPDIKPDLRGADLRGADLRRADLREADLCEANLTGADLTGADLTRANLFKADLSEASLGAVRIFYACLVEANLRGANLHMANLRGANLHMVSLRETDLREADLIGADLREADLRWANLKEADLDEADLTGANLSEANLLETDLTGADLREANLRGADLGEAYLRGANLSGANLSEANLRGANLSGANLNEADLTRAKLREANFSGARCNKANLSGAWLAAARLIDTNLDRATLTEAYLWETQRDGWSIKGVICESIYWDKEGREITDYSPGEFERMFTGNTRIRLFYKDGINLLEIATLPALIKHLEDSHPGCSLRLHSIHDDAGGAIVEFAIEDAGSDDVKQLKAYLEAEAQQKIEFQRQALAERETRLQLEGALKQSDTIIKQLILRPTIHQGELHMGDKYEISGQAGAVGPASQAHDNTFNQLVNRLDHSIDLTRLAIELAALCQAMTAEAKEADHFIAVGEIAKAEKAVEAKDSSKVVEHLKSAGKWAWDTATKIGVSVAAKAIEQSLGMK